MKSRLVCRVLVALGMSVTLCAAAAEAQACCLFGRSNTTYYAPSAVMAAPACNTCNTCNYVPQTTYRSVFTSVPVTTYRPITTVNPCTGCPVTSLQPVTTYRMQPSLVPVTTYRPVAACAYMPACPTGACGTPACATGACGAPAAPIASTYYTPSYSAAAASPGCSSCQAGATTYGGATYIPSTPQGSSNGTVTPSLAPNVPVPQPDSSSSLSAPPTFRPSAALDTTPAVRPIPDTGRSTNATVPPAGDSLDRQTARPREDRYTARPIDSSWTYQHASLKVVAPAETQVEEVSWHAAR